MTPEEAAKKIQEAVRALESGRGDTWRAALDFLRHVSTDYRVAINEFKSALASTSTDARMEAAAALAKFGRGESWVLPALKDAYHGEKEEFVRGRLAFSIASVKTSEAASLLVALLDQELTKEGTNFSVSAFCDALGTLGALAIPELHTVNKVVERCEERVTEQVGTPQELSASLALEALCRARSRLINETLSGYFSYTLESRHDHSARPILGWDLIDLDRSGPRFGDSTVVLDTRADYLVETAPSNALELCNDTHTYGRRASGRQQEVRCVLFERAPNEFICVAVWDHFASTSLMNKFEHFAQGVINALTRNQETPVRIEFGIFKPISEHAPTGDYTGVKLGYRGQALEITDWLPDTRLEELFGEHSKGVRALLRTPPPIPEGFLDFVQRRTHDALIEAALAEKRTSAPEAQLDYSELKNSFCYEVKQAARTGTNPIPKRPRICADTFDPPGNEEFFARALPGPIQDLVRACKRVADAAAARGNKNATRLEWPELTAIPQDFIVPFPRPYELEVEDGIAQVTLDLDPCNYGVVLFRCMHDEVEVLVTNIPFTVFEHNESFSWGYQGTGPLSLAKNILNAFVPPGLDGHPPVEANTTYWGSPTQTYVSHTAHQLALKFYQEMVRTLPAWGGLISAKRIKAWILAEVAGGGSTYSV